MSYRLNPYKIMRLFLIIAFLSYSFIEVKDYVKRKKEKTESVIKTLEIRKEDFVKSDEVKKKLVESSGTIENAEKVPTNEDTKKEEIATLDEDELETILKKVKSKNPQITRFKGLGEMNASQLRETTMDPNTRRLVQLDLDDIHFTAGLLDKLLAKKRSADRKHWLEQKGNLADLSA